MVVYRYLFTLDDGYYSNPISPVVLARSQSATNDSERKFQHLDISLMRTCKQIYEESAFVLYGENEFEADAYTGVLLHMRELYLTTKHLRLECIQYFSLRITFRGGQHQRFEKRWTFVRRMTSLRRLVITVLRKNYYWPKEGRVLKRDRRVREALERLVWTLPYPSAVDVVCTRTCFPKWNKSLGCVVGVVDDPTELIQEFTTCRPVKSISTKTHECDFCKQRGIA